MPILRKIETVDKVKLYFYQYYDVSTDRSYTKYYYDKNDENSRSNSFRKACKQRTAVKIKNISDEQCLFNVEHDIGYNQSS